MSDSELPRPNAYGIIFAVSLLASVVASILDGPAYLGSGLLVFAVLVAAVAMHRNRSREAGRTSTDEDDDEDGNSDAEKETRAQAGTMGMG